MYSVTANFSKSVPASATNVNARRVHATSIDTVRGGSRGQRLWIHGLPVTPGRSLAAALDAVLEGDLGDSIRRLAALDGAFAAFLWDPTLRKLVVVNDFMGMQPLYMRRTPGTLALAPTIRELTVTGEPDPAGWGAFVGFGHFVGERTSAADVVRIGPATILEYEPDIDRLVMRTYWEWPDIDSKLADPDTGALVDLLASSVESYAVYGTDGTLLLSGGYESRVLAALTVRAGRTPRALTLKNPYEHLEIDGRFAALVARQLGLGHDVRDPDPNFFSTEKYLEYVRLSDVATTSVNLFIAQVCAELQAAHARATSDGVCYGIVIKDKSKPSFEAFIRGALKPLESAEWQAARRVFSRDFLTAMWEQMHAALSDERSKCHDGPAGVAEFFVRNRARNRTTPNMLKVYANFMLPFMPGLTKELYEYAIRIPPSAKTHDALYRRILEEHFPALARLPFSTGGNLLPGTHGGDIGYHLLAARSAVVQHPRVGNILRRIGLAPARPASAVVGRAVSEANLDDPFLDPDGVRHLQSTSPRGTNDDTFARELVFYWSTWRELMGRARHAPVALPA